MSKEQEVRHPESTLGLCRAHAGTRPEENLARSAMAKLEMRLHRLASPADVIPVREHIICLSLCPPYKWGSAN